MASATEQIAPEVLALLCCPVTQQPLALAPAGLCERAVREVWRDGAGQPVTTLAAALLRLDGRMLYPIVDGIPRLIAAEGIPLP